MTTFATTEGIASNRYSGLRLTADEYFALPDDGYKYELIDGIVVMSPSATPRHQRVLMEIAFQLESYLRQHPVGMVFPETDVKLGHKLVYRPELTFIASARVAENINRIVTPPDMVLEVISPDSRSYDTQTKRTDYERAGVREYWIMDPAREQMTFLRLSDGHYVEVATASDRFESQAVPGFVLDLNGVRKCFQL